jgi:AbrB family looped-hinge helix DNA binding protein
MRIKVREKRQVTLPSVLLAALGVKAGDSLEAAIEDGKLTLRPARESALDALREIRKAFAESDVTLEELLESGRQVRKEIFRETYPELAEKYDI